jgi:hypothetical protein
VNARYIRLHGEPATDIDRLDRQRLRKILRQSRILLFSDVQPQSY